MAEVEAQLVRPDVGAGLAHVRAEASPQRGLQQMRGGVVCLGRVPGRVVDPREHALVRPQLAALEHDREHLVVAEPEHVLHARAAVAVRAFDRAHVRDLPAPGGVER